MMMIIENSPEYRRPKRKTGKVIRSRGGLKGLAIRGVESLGEENSLGVNDVDN
jgi:hypothetical protein